MVDPVLSVDSLGHHLSRASPEHAPGAAQPDGHVFEAVGVMFEPDCDVEKPGASLALMHPVRDRAQFLRAASPPVSLVEWVDHTAKTEPESPVFQMRGFGNLPMLIARVAPRYPDSAGSRPAASSS